MRQVDPETFERYVSLHAGQGRLLVGTELAAAVAASPAPPAPAAAAAPVPAKPAPVKARPLPAACKTLPPKARKHCRDSLEAKARATADSILASYDQAPAVARDSSGTSRAASANVSEPPAASPLPAAPADTTGPRALRELQAKTAHRDSLRRDSIDAWRHPPDKADAGRDTLVLGLAPERPEADASDGEDEEEADRTKGYFVNLFADVSDGGGGGWDGDDWAAVIYVVVGVVVVGAFLLYGVQTISNLVTNREHYPLFREAGLRLSYSGKAFSDPNGTADLFRDAYLAGLHFAIGLDRPGMGMGLAAEGGYIDVHLRGLGDPAKSFDFRGGYLMAGPLIRFGDNDPLSLSLEFLNGTSNHASIGWISKSRMTLQGRVGRHALMGAHLGAVFYDLHFLDGLAVRRGDFNRDLSLMYGLDAGWEF
jgi:hypothetical protein